MAASRRATRTPRASTASEDAPNGAVAQVDTQEPQDYSGSNTDAHSTKEGQKIMTTPIEIEEVDESQVPKSRRGPGSNPYFDYVKANYDRNRDVEDPKARKWSAFTIEGTDASAVTKAHNRLRSAGGRVVTGDTNGKGQDKGAGLQLSSDEIKDAEGNVTGYKVYFVAAKRRPRSPNGTHKQAANSESAE